MGKVANNPLVSAVPPIIQPEVKKHPASLEEAAGKSYRYERKFAVGGLSLPRIHSLIQFHPSFFREIFEPRQINNIYLDTHKLSYYYDNNTGTGIRKKARIRWYGDMLGQVKKPVLEYKLKAGLVGDKVSFPLAPFIVLPGFEWEDIVDAFERSDIPAWVREDLHSWEPTLLNTYKRTYFQTPDKDFRLTLDQDLTYNEISKRNNYFLNRQKDRESLIIELKYGIDQDTAASKISARFPFRMTKSSKYVNGIERFRNHLAI